MLSELFEQSLCQDFFKPYFKRHGKDYYFKENGVHYIVRTLSSNTTALRIETDKLKLFGGNPPSGVAKMCDAIFVTNYKNQDFIILVEIKTQHKGDYKKQLSNAQLFCQWQIDLLQKHGHIQNPPRYIGLLIYQGNPSQPIKGSTTLSPNKPETDSIDDDINMPIYLCPIASGNTIYLNHFLKN